MTLGNERIDQVAKFTYLGSIEQLKKSLEDQEDKYANQDYNIGSYSDDSVKYGSEAWALQKADKDLLDIFQRNRLCIVLGTWLTDCISKFRSEIFQKRSQEGVCHH